MGKIFEAEFEKKGLITIIMNFRIKKKKIGAFNCKNKREN